MKLYRPAALVTVCWVTPVALFNSVTCAPERTAPLGSVTVPLMPPRPAWEKAAIPVKKTERKKQKRIIPRIKPDIFMFFLLDTEILNQSTALGNSTARDRHFCLQG